jgi:hypothetical protein
MTSARSRLPATTTLRSDRAPRSCTSKLEENSGTPIYFARGGYGGTFSVVGTPAAYGVATTKGNGIRLGTAAYIQATHHPVFETPGATVTANQPHVESEATFSIHCAFPAALQNDWVIFSKADSGTDLSAGVSLRVHADGFVELRVRDHKYRPDVRMKAPAGTVTQGSEHHFTVSQGYQGAWFTVDGRQAELGFKNPLAWWSLGHRHQNRQSRAPAGSGRGPVAATVGGGVMMPGISVGRFSDGSTNRVHPGRIPAYSS